MTTLDWTRLTARANADGEFRLNARFWNATIRLEIGDARLLLRVRDGMLTGVEPWAGRVASDLTITGPAEGWDAMLAPTPRPFYHDLSAAAVHHGFGFFGDIRHRCAYYPALRRLIELMREVRNG